ncbi:MAG: hypothetical protein WC606_04720 [Candidatus Absconditabacterales bacterium]
MAKSKQPLNKDLNQIRHLELPEALKKDKKDFEIKEGLMNLLRQETGYQKDKTTSKAKRDRFAKIRDLGGDDAEKIKKLQEVMRDENEKAEDKESQASFLQKEIMERTKKGIDHHRTWLKNKTDELVNAGDKAGLEQLNKCIDFDNGKLILNTKLGKLKFAPKQATFDDVKNINGIKEGKNVWAENKESKKKGLRANFDAIQKMRDAGKKICSDEQFLAAANIFPGGDELTKGTRSTKTKDFFDLLGVEQYGFRNPNGKWNKDHRYLWSASASGNDAFDMKCYDAGGILVLNTQHYGFGLWFLED